MKRIDFNRGWTVTNEDGQSRLVNLPDDAMIYEERSKDFPTGGASGYFKPGKYTYTRTFNVPTEYAGQKVILECEGIYQNSHVILNGEELYFRPYGYTNYFVDLTDKLNYGQDNAFEIIADNSQAPNTRWYSGSGIYRELALHVGNKTSVAPEGIKITPLAKDEIAVVVELTDSAAVNAEIKVEILDEGKLIAESTGSKSKISVPNAILWDENTPKLYECRVTVSVDGNVVDTASEKFGIRIVSWDGRGLFVNDRSVLLRGACIHHDNGVVGACNFADAEYRRVKLLKEAGFNSIRSSHNPISKAMLRACDELGVYVMDETFDMWFIHKNPYDYGGKTFEKWWQTDVKQMIDKDYSHPSVILYSVGNEISDMGNAQGQAMTKQMADYVRSLDSTRAITSGCNLMLATMVAKGKGMYGGDNNNGAASIDNAPTSEVFNMLMSKLGTLMEMSAKSKTADDVVAKISKYLDLPGYNYAGMRYYKEAKTYPDRPFVGSETLPQKLYSNWEMVKDIPQLVGDFMWTGIDYLGESGIGTIKYVDKSTKQPVDPGLIVSGGAGVIDITGLLRPEVQWNKLIWDLTDEPGIGVEPMNMAIHKVSGSAWRDTDCVASWSWDGCEGYSNKVIVFAKGDSVQLSVNGKVVGKQKVKANKAIFKKVTYQPGEIEAVVFDASGNETGRTKLVSATGATAISATPDKTTLNANGQDLCFIDLNLVGANGIIKSNSDQKLTVTVDGPATLQGFGSAKPYMVENFYSDSHTTYRGHALAVVRAGYDAGEVTVTISGDNLDPVSVKLAIQ